MKERMHAAVAGIDLRVILSVMMLIVGLAAFVSWTLVLRGPFGEYERLKAAATSLSGTLESGAGWQAELNRLQTELSQLSERVDGELRAPSPDIETTAFFMTELERVAGRDGVLLTGVKPAGRRQVSGLEEISFEVGAQGKYLSLCRWLVDLKDALGQSVTVTAFEMKSTDEGRKVALSLKLALYRPLQRLEGRQ
jgi:Tfp pilus assembly protein PilO